jgi:hypothetical protein
MLAVLPFGNKAHDHGCGDQQYQYADNNGFNGIRIPFQERWLFIAVGCVHTLRFKKYFVFQSIGIKKILLH